VIFLSGCLGWHQAAGGNNEGGSGWESRQLRLSLPIRFGNKGGEDGTSTELRDWEELNKRNFTIKQTPALHSSALF